MTNLKSRKRLISGAKVLTQFLFCGTCVSPVRSCVDTRIYKEIFKLSLHFVAVHVSVGMFTKKMISKDH